VNLQSDRTRRLLITISAVSLVVLLAAGGTLLYLTRAPAPPAATPTASSSLPPIIITPPASLDELAQRYPQIANLLKDPALSSVFKDFMVAYEQGGITAAETLASERGLLSKNRELRITLVLDSADSSSEVTAELEKFGIVIEGAYRDQIDIAVPLVIIEQFAQTDDPGKLFSQLSGMDHIVKLRMPMSNRTDDVMLPSEAVTQTGALAWHQAGFTGKGVKVGVLDLGFDGYKKLLGKTLPENVTVKSFVSDRDVDQAGEVHGAACAEIIHAMAPDAELYLAYYNGSETGLGRGVEWLIAQGVRIISHSASGLAGPMDGSGSQAQLVDEVTAKGILWVNASGNYAQDHYRFTFNDANGDGKHIFPNGKATLLYNPPSEDARIILNWDDWGGNVTEDYDLYLYDDSFQLVAASEDAQGGKPGDRPIEFIRLSKPKQKSYYIVIMAKQVTRPATFNLYAPGSNLGYHSADYSLGTPADAHGSLTVGAIAWRNNRLEPFSSQGPTNDNRLKPEIAAPDGVATLSYRPRIFDGTSASAPHVAGAAALVMQRFPDLKAADVAAFLQSNAVDMGPSGPDPVYGYGRLQLPAVTQAEPPPVAPKTPIVVTSQPVAVQPAPVEPTTTNAGTLLACLSCLVCGGAVGSLGGLTFLVVASRPKPRPAPAAYAPPPPMPPAPQWQPPSYAPPFPQQAALSLVGVTGQRTPGAQQSRVVLRLGKNVVGRLPGVEILMDDPQVSRRHAEITWDGARCTVMDAGSHNGTFVNGARLIPNVPVPLRPGDRVSFGTASVWTVTG
jgi:subtilisin family serine protease